MALGRNSQTGDLLRPIYIFGIACLLWFTTLSLLFYAFGMPDDPAESGQFGDSFGVVNTLFSGLAFGAVIVSIRQQKAQAHDDRQIAAHQMFESTFFEMNRVARETKASIILNYYNGKVFSGVDAANELRRIFMEGMSKKHSAWQHDGPSCEEICIVFSETIREQAIFSEFIAFFSVISAELKFLESRDKTLGTDISYEETLRDIIRASLDSSTLAIMLLYGLTNPHLKQMIEDYDLAKYMNPGEVWRLCRPHYMSLQEKAPYASFRLAN